MGKKIVAITGSPRNGGNSFAMTDAFIQAEESKGHTVTRFDAAMMKIGGCRACETRCPFGVKIADRMARTAAYFGSANETVF